MPVIPAPEAEAGASQSSRKARATQRNPVSKTRKRERDPQILLWHPLVLYNVTKEVTILTHFSRVIGSPGTGVTGSYEPPCGCWKPKPRSSTWATSVLNCWVISPAPTATFLYGKSNFCPSLVDKYLFCAVSYTQSQNYKVVWLDFAHASPFYLKYDKTLFYVTRSLSLSKPSPKVTSNEHHLILTEFLETGVLLSL